MVILLDILAIFLQDLEKMARLKTVLTFLTCPSLAFACRHVYEKNQIALTSFEVVLFFVMIVCFAWFSWIVPTVFMNYREIRDILAERKRRYLEYRKLQKKKNLQVHVPLHFLRNYYEQGSASTSKEDSQASEHSRRRIVNILNQ